MKLVNYEETHQGMINSWRDRFSAEEHQKIDQWLDELVKKDAKHFNQ